ncbi:MAG: magnesium transporter [Methanobrevibacter sp.]|nr:magnesium transporter [Methanobrevibacter sp.]
MRNLMKMIRQFGHSTVMFVVNFILFLFNIIRKIIELPSLLAATLRSFLEDTNSVITESLISLLICAFGCLFTGIILGNMEFYLETFPGLMVIIPGAIGMRGNIFGSFGSRLSTHLHIGTLSPEFKRSDILTENITSSIILTMVLSVLLGIIAKAVCIIFNFPSISLFDFVLISFIAGLISSIIMLPITMFISLKSFENGWDPDNITTPLIAAFGDFFTLPAIVAAIYVVQFVSIVPIVEKILFALVIISTVVALAAGYTSDKEIRNIVRQSTPVLFVCSILGTLAGGILNGSITTLLKSQTLLTLVPLFSGESGGLVSVLSARLSSGLHSGLIDADLKPGKVTLENFSIVIFLSLIMFPIIGFLAEASTTVLGNAGVNYLNAILISLIAGMIVVGVMLLIVFYISTISYRKGLDPDNIVIPLSTSLTDSISTLVLVVVSLIILAL